MKIAVSVEECKQRIESERGKIAAIRIHIGALNQHLDERLRELDSLVANKEAANVRRIVVETMQRMNQKTKSLLNKARILNHKMASLSQAQLASPSWLRTLERMCEAYI